MEYTTEGFGYGTISVETNSPLNENNPHYLVLNVEDEAEQGVGLSNSGFWRTYNSGREKINFSTFIKLISVKPIPFEIKLQNSKGEICAKTEFTAESKDWKDMLPCSIVKDAKSGDLIIKVVNVPPRSVNATVKLKGVNLKIPLDQKPFWPDYRMIWM